VAARRIFYVTQQALVVYQLTRHSVVEVERFSNSDEGFLRFSAHLENAADEPGAMLIDVIEEEFSTDSVPRVSKGDRNSLLARRLRKRFSRTPYRTSIELPRDRNKEGDGQPVLYAAITNPELVDPWLNILEQYKTPLTGVYSVALMGAEFLKAKVGKIPRHALLLSIHQKKRLRLVFIDRGQVVSARLSRVISPDREEFDGSLVAEVSQSRKYLERARHLQASDPLDVYFVADADISERAFSGSADAAGIRLHTIDLTRAAAKAGLSSAPPPGHGELLFLMHCAHRRATLRYPNNNRKNYAGLARVRQAILGVAVAAGLVCAVVGGFRFAEGLVLQDRSNAINAQLVRLEETYRRENEEFQPLRAGSHEMKLAVDTGEFLQRNALPVEWALQQIGNVLTDHDAVVVNGMGWEVRADSTSAPANPRPGEILPLTIPAAASVQATVKGQLDAFDGDLRLAFARIDDLASDLESRTDFDQVAVVEYPIDARPAAAISGEVRNTREDRPATFALQLTLNLADGDLQ